MKAIVATAYGPPDVLQFRELEKPVPKSNEILIKIHATTVTQGDRRFRTPNPIVIRLLNGLIRPRLVKIFGLELAGEVEEVGEEVKRFIKGDHVFAFTGFHFGAHAEYKCMKEDGPAEKNGLIAIKPTNMTFEQAASVPCGGLTALGLLKKANIQQGQKVLIYGASGSVGTYAVQFAKHFRAEVTGVCSTNNLEMVKALGADKVIDYTQDDFTQNGEKYDIIIDAVRKKAPSDCKRALTEGGVFFSSHSSTKPALEDLLFIKTLIEDGAIRAFIDRCYSFKEIIEAHRYVDLGRKKGNVVISMNQKEPSVHHTTI